MERTAIRTTSRWPAWLNAGILLLASLAANAALAVQVRPGAEVVAVVFPPWWTSQQAFEAAATADAAIVATTAIAGVLMVSPNHQDGLTRLREAGAWLAIDTRTIAACFHQDKEI
jgi:hypothetical protein